MQPVVVSGQTSEGSRTVEKGVSEPVWARLEPEQGRQQSNLASLGRNTPFWTSQTHSQPCLAGPGYVSLGKIRIPTIPPPLVPLPTTRVHPPVCRTQPRATCETGHGATARQGQPVPGCPSLPPLL